MIEYPVLDSGALPSDAQARFAGLLARHRTRGLLDLEVLCSEHPADARPLRTLHAEWPRTQAVASISSAGSGSLTARSTPKSGADGPPATHDDAGGRGRILVPALMALMGAGLFAYVYTGAPVVPVWDGWTWIAQAKAYDEGGVGELMRIAHPLTHGQHLYFLPSMIALIVGPLVDYSFRPFAFLCLVAMLACAVLFYRLARKSGLGRFEALVVFLCVASFRQYENLLSGFQLGFPLCVLLGSLAVIVADRQRDRRGFAIALALAMGSALSSSAGIMAGIAILLVRWFDPRRPRNWIAVALGAVTVMVLVHFTLSGFGVMRQSVVAYGMQQLTWSALPVIFRDGVMLVGGGLASGRGSTPVGLCLLGGACALLITRVRRTNRIDALCGLILFSLACTAAIAIARSPFAEPDSRYAIFASPLVCACAIGLLRVVRSCSTGLRAASGAALAVGLAWLCADAIIDSADYRRLVDAYELETRTSLARLAGGEKLTKDELLRVNPGRPRFIESLMKYLRDRRLSIFSSDYHGIEIHEELPTRPHDVTATVEEGGVLRFAGPGYLYNAYTCTFPSGCGASLSVDLAVEGKATIGIFVRRADGTEKENFNIEVPAGEGFGRRVVRGEAEAGDTLEPYAFAFGPEHVVRIESFNFVLLQKSQIP